MAGSKIEPLTLLGSQSSVSERINAALATDVQASRSSCFESCLQIPADVTWSNHQPPRNRSHGEGKHNAEACQATGSDEGAQRSSIRYKSSPSIASHSATDVCASTVVPSEDSHSSEYIAACDARREFISGFTGSAGCAVITETAAALATDGRYFNQATQQLDENWTLLKQGLQDVPTWQEWAAEQSAGGKTVAVDSTLVTASIAKKLAEKIRKSGGSDLVPLDVNLVDAVWADDRPARPQQRITVLSEKFAGKSVQSKLSDVFSELEKKRSPGLFISMLDEVAWLFNLRGNDIPYNPVFFSYAVITPKEAALYVDESKLDEECREHLNKCNVAIKPYESFFRDAELHHKQFVASNQSAEGASPAGSFLMSNKGSWALKRALGGDGAVEEIRSPIGDAKAIKNETEMEGMRACHIRDGAALIEYFAWLEDQLVNKKTVLDEVQAADKLEELRSKHEHFVGLSFPTISSTGAKLVSTA